MDDDVEGLGYLKSDLDEAWQQVGCRTLRLLMLLPHVRQSSSMFTSWLTNIRHRNLIQMDALLHEILDGEDVTAAGTFLVSPMSPTTVPASYPLTPSVPASYPLTPSIPASYPLTLSVPVSYPLTPLASL